MRLFRILLAIIILFLSVCFIAVGCLLMFVDPNKLKPIISQEVKKQTGSDVKFAGNLSWSFYPRVGVAAERVTIIAPGQSPILLNGIKLSVPLADLSDYQNIMNGRISVDQIQVMKLKLQKINGVMTWKNQTLSIENLTAIFYQGTIKGNLLAKSLNTVPEWKINTRFAQVDIDSLLKDLNGSDSKLSLSGLMNGDFQGVSKGLSRNQFLTNLNGKVGFNLAKGSLQGIDINYYIQIADGLINKKSVSDLVNTKQTLFNSLQGSLQIHNGLAETNDLSLVSTAFSVRGLGNLGLINQDINMRLNIKSYTENKWEIPLGITGKLQDPNIKLNLEDIEKMLLQQNIGDLKTKASEEITKHIPGKAGEILQNLLGR